MIWLVPGLLLASGGPSAAPSPLVRVPVYRLTCQVLSTAGGGSVVLADGEADLEPDRAGTLEMDLPWDSDGAARLTVNALREEGTEGGHRLHLEALLRPPSGKPARLARALDLAEGGTALLELHRRPGRTLVLALTLESDSRTVVRVASEPGRPVLFHLSVERVRGDETVPLETNELHTFVGEGVEYAFERGAEETAEAVRLRLTPVRVEGDLVEIEVELEGRLPQGPPLDRRERLLATRASTTSFDAAAGSPPAGYRFRIRPVW